MAMVADRYTDKAFSQLESRISKMYREAQRDLKNKLADFTRHHKAKDAEMRKKLRSGEITQAQYQQWMTGQVFVGKQWKQKIEQVNGSIKNVMQEASNLTHGKSMDVFAENANYTAYQLEKDLKANINFGLYDTSTVSRLVGKDPEILPRRVVNGRKLDAWETKKISNAISQGIIQGEGIDQIASRIARDTCIAADHSSVMYARTAMTAAQNAGRMERLHEAEEMGIRVQKKWMATLDNRTRDSHADLDGEVVDVDDTFSNGLMYPGDPSTNDFAEICNCRCTMVYVYPDFKQSFERSAFLGYDENGHKQYETIKDMTYRKWQASKKGTATVGEEPEEPTFRQPTKDEYDGGEEVLERERQKLREVEEQRQEIMDQLKRDRYRIGEIRYERSQLDDTDPKIQELAQEMNEIIARRNVLLKKDEDLYKEQSGYFHAKLVDKAQSRGVEYNIPTKLETPNSVDTIIERVGGGDMTTGSCVSLGFCYVGQTEGYDVIDFRGGQSQDLFSRVCDDVLRGISREMDKPLLTESTSTGTGGSVKLIKQTIPGHEYYFSCGRHAAIVRSNDDGRLEYLELQSRSHNGWKLLGYKDDRKSMDYTFTNRFGCSRGINGTAYMMDVEDMRGSKILHRAMGYINTASDKQKKGTSGYER